MSTIMYYITLRIASVLNVAIFLTFVNYCKHQENNLHKLIQIGYIALIYFIKYYHIEFIDTTFYCCRRECEVKK